MKPFLPFLLVFCISITNISAQIDLQSGLVGDYSFSGNANDLSSSLNHGTVNGATLTTDRFGNPNSAYSFDGTNDYISINNDPLNAAEFSYSI